jgi:hypothetical protein
MNANNRIENLFYIVAAFALVCVLALAVTISGGGGDTTTGCSMNPMTHEEIINACTDAQSVDIAPFFPASAPNGTLPALPN